MENQSRVVRLVLPEVSVNNYGAARRTMWNNSRVRAHTDAAPRGAKAIGKPIEAIASNKNRVEPRNYH